MELYYLALTKEESKDASCMGYRFVKDNEARWVSFNVDKLKIVDAKPV